MIAWVKLRNTYAIVFLLFYTYTAQKLVLVRCAKVGGGSIPKLMLVYFAFLHAIKYGNKNNEKQ